MEAHEYIGFGLNFESEYPLPGAHAGSDPSLPVVSIRRARASESWSEFTSRCDAGDFLVARLPDVLYFCVRSGREIIMRPDENADPGEAEFLIRTMSSNFALALLLRQRGFLTLHASVLRNQDTTIAFVGESGWGKSTLAEFFSQHGYEVLSDDIGAINIDGDSIRVVPGHPLVKLRSEASQHLLNGAAADLKTEPDGRVFRTKKRFLSAPVPLDRLYLLTPSFSSEVTIEQVAPQQAVLALAKHTHGAHLMTRKDYQTSLLQQCSEIVNRIPTQVLYRRKGIEHLPEVLKAVEIDLQVGSPSEKHAPVLCEGREVGLSDDSPKM